MSYVLPNRRQFADSITRMFLKYRQKGLVGTDDTTMKGQLYPYQKLVRDYLLIETTTPIALENQPSNRFLDVEIISIKQQ